jgi:hypothetical protein
LKNVWKKVVKGQEYEKIFFMEASCEMACF